MSANTKRWINRGGLVAMIVGTIAIVVAGGDMSAAQQTTATVATIAGSVMVLLREILG